MKATELIRELQGLVEAHGDDLEVYLSPRLEGGVYEQLQLKAYDRQINSWPDGRLSVSGPAVVFSPVPEPISELARKRSRWKKELDALPQPQEPVKAHCNRNRADDWQLKPFPMPHEYCTVHATYCCTECP